MLKLNEQAPDFTLRDLSGESVQLSKQRGEVVLLDFWATWCGPCRYDMPFVQNLAERYRDRGLRVFGINAEPADTAAAYLRENELTFPTLQDPGMRIAKLYKVNYDAKSNSSLVDTVVSSISYLKELKLKMTSFGM